MEALSAAAVLAAVLVHQITETRPIDEKRAIMTNERLETVANVVMDKTTMVQYCILLDSFPNEAISNWQGNENFLKKFTNYMSQKPHTIH